MNSFTTPNFTRLYKSLLASVLLLGLGMIFSASPAKALSSSDFQAGRVIDNVVFTNNTAMSVADIQNFLNAKVPVCDTNGTQLTTHPIGSGGYYTRAQWGAQYDSVNNTTIAAAPYTCLKNYSEGGLSAAQIIYNTAQTYSINPEVLIVTLQKEQGLVTDDWPWQNEYQEAMGYMCPDTPQGCNSSYAGFAKQVDSAAWQFRYYLDHNGAPGNFWVGNYYIPYNPVASCGGTVVNIQNSATAALYDYTPYQPNPAATAVMNDNTAGGSVDCGAYGNRNFFWYFTKWFGTTYAPQYSWQLLDQYAYTDQTKTVGKGTTGLFPGDMVYVGIKVKNTGNLTWTNNGANLVKVGTLAGMDRNSAFCTNWGYGCNRPAAMVEQSVAPGGIATFEWWMKAPSTAGNYPEHFGLVIDGAAWFNDLGLTFSMSVTQPVYTWQMVDQYAYTDETKVTGKGTAHLLPGDRVYVGFKARNTGNVTWKNTGPNPVNVGMTHPLDRLSAFYDGTWLGQNRPAHMTEASVAPGQIGTFEFWMNAPKNPGTYLEYFDLVAEGAAWMPDPGLNFYMTVDQPVYTWQMVDQYAYTDQTKTVGKGTTNLNPGDRVYVGFTARNTGNVTWKNTGPNPVNVGMTHPLDRLSLFYDGTWLGQNRPAHMLDASVAPGQIGRFEFWMTAPNTSGKTYLEYFDLVAEGAAWMPDPGLNFYMSTH